MGILKQTAEAAMYSTSLNGGAVARMPAASLEHMKDTPERRMGRGDDAFAKLTAKHNAGPYGSMRGAPMSHGSQRKIVDEDGKVLKDNTALRE